MARNLVAASLLVVGLMIVLSNCDGTFSDGKQTNDDDPNDDGETTDGESNVPEDELVANPEVVRLRTFYKLYKSPDGTCYLLPRPDADATAMDECAADTDIGKKLVQYQVCEESPDPEVINNLPCDVGLEFSTLLNNGIEFTKERPYPGLEDRVAACDSATCSGHEAVADYCAYYKDQAEKAAAGLPIPAIARLDTDQEMGQIATCLNELYGVPATP